MLSRSQFDIKEDASIGVANSYIAENAIGKGTMKILVVVGCAQLPCLGIPFGLLFPTLHNVFRFHFKQVREIGAQRQFQQKMDLPARIIGNIQILVNALADDAVDCDAQALLIDNATIRFNARVG